VKVYIPASQVDVFEDTMQGVMTCSVDPVSAPSRGMEKIFHEAVDVFCSYICTHTNWNDVRRGIDDLRTTVDEFIPLFVIVLRDFIKENAGDLYKEYELDTVKVLRKDTSTVCVVKNFDVVDFGQKRLTKASRTLRDPAIMHQAALELLSFELTVSVSF
jgi:hypothetical protein